jgi:hypothetical protein
MRNANNRNVSYLAVVYQDSSYYIVGVTDAAQRRYIPVIFFWRDNFGHNVECSLRRRTVDMHPALMKLHCCVVLDVVYAFCQPFFDRYVQDVTKSSCDRGRQIKKR